jgi:hypothetical protein
VVYWLIGWENNGLLDLLDLSSILWSFPWKIGFLNLPISIKNSAVDYYELPISNSSLNQLLRTRHTKVKELPKFSSVFSISLLYLIMFIYKEAAGKRKI